jgi:fructoselysine 6-kinase
MKLITVGDNVADTYVDSCIFYPGGNCVNVAVDAKKAGAQAVGYMGIFGNDKQADHIQNALRVEQVDLVNCRQIYAPTAQPSVFLTAEGDRQFAAGPKGSAQHLVKLRLTSEDSQTISEYDVLHTGIHANINHELITLKSLLKISYDFSDVKDENYLAEVLPNVNYAFFSGSDMTDEMAEAFSKSCLAQGPDIVIITRGAQSALIMSKDAYCYQEPQLVDVVDTMGAGDSFIAGFLVAYTDTHDLQAAALAASQSAANTCGVSGGFGHGQAY